jgi:hypothetical protein
MTSNTNRLDGMDMTDELINLLREIRPSFSDVGSRDVDTRRKQNQIDHAIELLSASKPAALEGWKMVPVEPDDAMIEAAQKVWHTPYQCADPTMHVWDAMLAASPATPSSDMQDDRGALLPCPFCGDQAEYKYNSFHDDDSMAVCRCCGAQAFWKKWQARAASTSANVAPAATVQAGEAIYQRLTQRDPELWSDVRKATFDVCAGRRRIVYAAPQSSQPVEAGEAKRFPTPISISTDKICEIAGKYNLGNPRLDALRGFVNEVIIVNEAEYAKSE